MLQPQAEAARAGGLPAKCAAATDASTGILP